MEAIQARPAVARIIEEVAKKQSFNGYTITDVSTNKKGEGYLGEIFMVTVKDAHGTEKVDVVIKAAFSNEKIRQTVPIARVFQNEIIFYHSIYPEYLKLEKEHGFTTNVQIVPRLFAKSNDELEEMLVLENLKKIGFEVISKRSILDEDHSKLIFETYGQFHAHAYVFRDQNPEKYAKLTSNIQNIYKELMQTPFVDGLRQNLKPVEKALIPGEDDKIIEKFKSYQNDGFIKLFLESITETDNFCGLIHGDCWSNNMMFKYKDEKPVEMKLLDFQIIRIGSPVCDLSYCLYSGSSKDIFDNLDDYLKIYHNAFSYHVRKLGSDPDKLYPFSVLKQHWKKYAKFGFMMGISVLRLKLTVQEDLIDLTDVDLIDEKIKDLAATMKYDTEEFNRRVRDLLQHLYEIDAF